MTFSLRGRSKSKSYQHGYEDGLREARGLVICAPVLTHGQRIADIGGGFPRVRDEACDPNGNPNLVYCDYALRDAILYWIDERLPSSLSSNNLDK